MGRPKKQPEKKNIKPGAKSEPKNDTKTEILKTFIKLCYWKGADSVTLQMLAKEHKVAFNTVHYHFHRELHRLAYEYTLMHQKTFVESRLNKIINEGEKNSLRGYV